MNSSTSNFNLIKFSLFIMLFLILNGLLEIYVRKNSRLEIFDQKHRIQDIVKKLKEIELKKSTFVLGSSIVFYGIRTDILTSDEDKFYNFGIRGESPRTMLYLFKQHNILPKRIIIDTFSYNINIRSQILVNHFNIYWENSYKNWKTRYERFLQYHIDSNIKSWNPNHNINWLYNSVINEKRIFVKIKRSFDTDYLAVKTKPTFPHGISAYKKKHEQKNNEFIESLFKQMKKESSAIKNNYSDLFEEAKYFGERGVEIIFVRIPHAKQIFYYETELISKFKETVKQSNFHLINLAELEQWKNYNLRSDVFFSTHLYDKDALFLSNLLKNELKKL
jgi:hypothetical protein